MKRRGMNSSSNRRIFEPMSERTLENAQIYLLSNRYDLSRDSILAREIVSYVNNKLDEEEAQRGIKRVKPGELLIKTSRGDIVLPLRTEADIQRAILGERLENIRRDIFARCVKKCQELFPEVLEADKMSKSGVWVSKARKTGRSPKELKEEKEIATILRALSACSLSLCHDFVKKRWTGCRINSLPICQQKYGSVNEELMAQLLEETGANGNRVKQSISRSSSNLSWRYRTEIRLEIINFLGKDAGVPPAVREPMFLDLARLRSRFCPLIDTLDSGQMPLVSMHMKAGRRLELPTRLQPLAPVIVSIITPQDLEHLGENDWFEYSELMKVNARRMARVLIEAYQQDGLISYSELQWCFLTSANSIGRILGWYQHKHNVILPCPGTVLDMGRMLTHKDIIVRLHLQGMTVLEISRQTYHAPRSVDAYLKVFDSVLILHLYGLPLKLISRVLNRGESLIEEYLQLITENLKEVKGLRKYLQSRGVKLPEGIMAC